MHLVDEAFENIVRYKLPHTSEMRIIFPDGTFRWFQNNMIPVFKDNKLVALKGINLDITDRKNVEKALQESEEKFRLIMENSADSIFITNQQGKYLYTNKAVSIMLGYTSEEMKSKTIAEISPPNKIEEYFEFFKQILSEGKGFTEIELLRKDGGYISTDLNAVVLPNGQVYGSCRDITKRKQTENDLRDNYKRLRQLNVDKDRFISILGHDLKSPFNNLIGLSEVLKVETTRLKTEEIEDIAKDIHKSAKIANKLLDDILMWARTQQGKIPFKPQILSFKDIFKDTLEILTPNANAKNITIKYFATDKINVFADIDMIKTVLRNLVSNAIKFTNSGGSINIDAKQNSENVIISVSDNGIGIPPDNLTKLFDISEVLTTTGTAKETGTGLGLLLCKEFVDKHGGKIWVESEVGKGSDFIFNLPISTGNANGIIN
jgi:PAS domain S-box-containing protein